MSIKKFLSCLLVSVIAVTLFGCGNSGKAPSEETETSETTAAALSEEELNALAENMPEIVFVMSHHYDRSYYDGSSFSTNILGFYITNTGEMKMYDFREIAPDEVYEIPDVYDRLEEATCSEIIFLGPWSYSQSFTESRTKEVLIPVSENELKEYYKKLLSITGEAEYESLIKVDCDFGDFRYYGVKINENGENECILLSGKGDDYHYRSDDEYIEEVGYWAYRTFPNVPLYDDAYTY